MTDAIDYGDDRPRWFCERCQGQLRGDGRIWIDVDDPSLTWHVTHDTCASPDEAGPFFVLDRDIDTWKLVTRWTVHFLDKPWFPKSDWWRVVRALGDFGPLASGGMDVHGGPG